ncbi:hypothetical protein OG322_39875 [Streptomyces sp. NBC_01260]|uniref:hypothetical protein n=1 Tax=unclassified Streptomyces TaxID=2593676 RepID=UPI000F4A806F|nr:MULTISPECIES: hypothetical protein [unclassified Streptomyces]MCX4774872.1 hypothetical protein [Streptomyces sp. NBC_01285]ROQ78318.1 hypothetical protein EDD95_4937 [Streptomyces sp. CEV 2-1]RPK37337.1 hypothetical protein EES39_30870 [Streptomyces sp. ADI92-24]
MAAIARWCIRHRLAALLIWLAALGGTATAAGFAGSDLDFSHLEGGEDEQAAGIVRDVVLWHSTQLASEHRSAVLLVQPARIGRPHPSVWPLPVAYRASAYALSSSFGRAA